jgi:hypothetical protein
LRYIFILLACTIFSTTAFADPTSNSRSTGKSVSSAGTSSDIKASNNQIGLQSISTNVNYTEVGNGVQTTPGTLDTESGPVHGQAYYVSAMNDVLFGNDYFKGTYDQSAGVTNYVGGTLNPPSAYGSVTSTSGATLTNYTLRYGKGFPVRGTSMLTPYVEIGSHKWDRGVNYGETYSHNYFGIGLLNQYSLGNSLVLSVDAMFGHTRDSTISVTSSPSGVPAASQITGFTTALGDSTLYRVGLSFDYGLGPRVHLNAGVDYSAFIYGISATQPSGLLEPDSRTNYTTVRFGLGFGF